MSNNLKAPKKIYCPEKNEIYPSITFIKDRIASNVWVAIANPDKALNGLHYRYATPEDEKGAKIVTKEDYPDVRKKSKRPKLENSDQPIKRCWSNEEMTNLKKSRTIADSMSDYLNQLESIFTRPMGDQEKVEAFNMAALLVGKLMVSFCDFCEKQEIYVERGVRGGRIKPKASENNKEDDYDFVEVEQ